MKTGLIGNEISEQIFNEFDLSCKRINSYIKSLDFNGIYIDFPNENNCERIDVPSENSKRSNVVDTIIFKNELSYGFNSDYDAFMYCINRHAIDLKDKKVLIIGNNWISKSILPALEDLNVKEIYIVDQNPDADSISYTECYARHLDSQIVIHTGLTGMNPDIDSIPIDIHLFLKCELLIDYVYDPLISKIAQDALQSGIQTITGIELKIAKIKFATEKIKGASIQEKLFQSVLDTYYINQLNIVLIGMPSAGKTTIGKLLETKLHKSFIDMDEIIVQDTHTSIPEIFKRSGEAGFRKLETMTALKLSVLNQKIIGTGGGTIKNKINIDLLKLNGVVIFIDRDLDKLVTYDPNRPLSSSQEAVKKLYEERFPIYQKYADITVKNNDKIEDTVEKIICELNRIVKNKKSV
ncbi:shikimate kinase [Floccifex porci]|uniref:Shikimate kinase n=1 Tax=Floccifex porci TaxID=2606629 RepID=A0A7X2N1C1_9FIRM|nr:shikimate kinase [Floccifex porci]MSS00640.1 shikimate dehydrogenase [Floccifex porci]